MTSAARSKRSKKRSASKRAKRRKPLTFFLDENLGRTVANGLRDAGYAVVSAIDTNQGEADRVWIPEVAALDYVLLTRDQAIRRNPLEVRALWNSGLRAFVLTANAMRPAETLQLLLGRMTKITRICARKGPFLYAITASGLVSEFAPKQLARMAEATQDNELADDTLT